jgi:RNA polymerase sigma-70 factor (ECF subfamily)
MTGRKLIKALEQHHKDGYRWACQCCGYDQEKAKDVLQEVYLKILDGKARYKGRSKFKTWFYSVIRFTAIDHLNGVLPVKPIEWAKGVIEEEVREPKDLRILLSKLSPKQAEVLLLVFYHDQTLEQAAEVMGVSLGTVRTHYHRGKISLKEMLKQAYYG